MNATHIPNLEAYLQRCLENPDEAEQIIAEASQALRTCLDAPTDSATYTEVFDAVVVQIRKGLQDLKEQIRLQTPKVA